LLTLSFVFDDKIGDEDLDDEFGVEFSRGGPNDQQ
jgi:hypothetical protein